MALKKSDLFTSFWAACDQLRGRMDSSDYKDYVLAFLFLKCVSENYAGKPSAPFKIPAGSNFADLVALKGSIGIGSQINKGIIAPLVDANDQLSHYDFPDFNDANKLGSGREMVDRLSNLISIFQSLDFELSKDGANAAEAFERLFADFVWNEGSGFGEFCTHPVISGIVSKVVGIESVQTSGPITIYDPTCGTGSLLLKVAKEARGEIHVFGQELNRSLSSLARMNMIVNGEPMAVIADGDSLTEPRFIDGDSIRRFDFVVANPPFSAEIRHPRELLMHDPWGRFAFGIPSRRSADYAFLQHMIASLKPEGRMAVLVPPGSLFRGGSEGEMRRRILEEDLIEGIIGLPTGVVRGTAIPSCILVLSRRKNPERQGKVFFINANRSAERQGTRNVLPPEQVSRIVDAYQGFAEIERFSRTASLEEIERNDFNLNVTRYVDSSELSGLLEQFNGKFQKFHIKELEAGIHSVARGNHFTEQPNAVYIPKIVTKGASALKPTSDLKELGSREENYFQVILDDRALNEYIALFLRTDLGKHSLGLRANGDAAPRLSKDDLEECTIAIPDLKTQKAVVETHRKLSALRDSIEEIDAALSLNPTGYEEFDSQLDLMLEAIGRISEVDHIRSLLRQGESKTVEFKETYSLCLREKTKQKYVEDSSLKTVAAFLNSEGGTLLIGVSDVATIVGIELELDKFHGGNRDKFLLHFKNALRSRIGEQFYPFISYDLVVVEEMTVLKVVCLPSRTACFMDENTFYVRTNPSTDKIEGLKLIEYVKSRFKD